MDMWDLTRAFIYINNQIISIQPSQTLSIWWKNAAAVYEGTSLSQFMSLLLFNELESAVVVRTIDDRRIHGGELRQLANPAWVLCMGVCFHVSCQSSWRLTKEIPILEHQNPSTGGFQLNKIRQSAVFFSGSKFVKVFCLVAGLLLISIAARLVHGRPQSLLCVGHAAGIFPPILVSPGPPMARSFFPCERRPLLFELWIV